MNRLIASVTVHLKSGEKQKLALVETENDYVVASGFISEADGWTGNGEYIFKSCCTATFALRAFADRVEHESESIFVDRITF